MDIIKKTGLTFESGARLSAADLSKMNNIINALVEAVNNLMLACFDVNQELNDFSRTFTVSQAIGIVSQSRRQKGMKVRFLSESGLFAEYSYRGDSLSDADFLDSENWVSGIEVVDGGEF